VPKLIASDGPIASLVTALKGSPLRFRILGASFFFASVAFGTIVWHDVSAANNVMMKALRSPLEATPHPDTAIEALLLASVLQDTATPPKTSDGSVQPDQSTPNVSKEFSAELDNLQSELTSAVAKVPSTNSSILLDKSQTAAGISLGDKNPGFLFIPSGVLGSLSIVDSLAEVTLNKADNPLLYKDVSLSQTLSTSLCSDIPDRYTSAQHTDVSTFDRNSDLLDQKFKQAYIIFASGVTRLCEASLDSPTSYSQHSYYIDKFSPDTYLQQRPYFEQTVLVKHTLKSYWTGAYVDLGGNGIVRTYCHYLDAGSEDAIVCFDFSLKQDMRASIRNQVDQFGGTATEFSCANSSCSKSDQEDGPFDFSISRLLHPSTLLTAIDVQQLNREFKAAAGRGSQAAFTGKLSVLAPVGGNSMGLIVVPLGDNHILVIKLDLESYQRWRSVWIAVATICITATALMTMLVIFDYSMKLREQERAFNAVDTVMSDVPAAYARVDDDGKFIKVNDAFAKLVGFSNAEEALPRLRSLKYEDFLPDEDKELYERIKEERREGKKYRSYSVRLFSGGAPGVGDLISVRVHGGDVPTPHAARGKPGQSFGILIREESPKPFVVNSVSGLDAVVPRKVS